MSGQQYFKSGHLHLWWSLSLASAMMKAMGGTIRSCPALEDVLDPLADTGDDLRGSFRRADGNVRAC